MEQNVCKKSNKEMGDSLPDPSTEQKKPHLLCYKKNSAQEQDKRGVQIQKMKAMK